MDVSVIIVNYNTKELLKNCLNSIYKQTKDIEFEVIVSDNGSVDNSIEMVNTSFPQVILIENNANLGFGTANNRGLKVAKGKYIFYLNSDTILLNNAIKYFFDYWENSTEKEKIGALGCNLVDENMKITHSYEKFPDCDKIIKNLVRANYGLMKEFLLQIFKKKKKQELIQKKNIEKKIGEVDYICGADLFLLNNDFALFDEKIFLYVEEVDLQYRLMKNEKKRLLIDGPLIIHLEGKASKKNKTQPFPTITNFSSRCNNISLVYYFRKNISRYKAFLVKVGILFLWLNPLVINFTKKSILDLIRR